MKYRRMPSRWVVGLILYWFLAIGGASLARESREAGWIILVMLVFLAICMVYERSNWGIWKRIGFVLLSWVLQSIISVLVVFSIGLLINEVRPHLVNRATSFIATLPLVIYGMQRSLLFVKKVQATGQEVKRSVVKDDLDSQSHQELLAIAYSRGVETADGVMGWMLPRGRGL